MFEGISEVLEERKAETKEATPVKVIKEVVDLMKANQGAVLYNDFSDYPKPRIVYTSEAVLKDWTMAIEIEEELEKDVICILLSNAALSPGTPKDRGSCYRVDIVSGEAAVSYRKSTGHIFEILAGNLGTDNGKTVISDSWAETNLTPEEVLGMLSEVKSLQLPKFDKEEKTSTGTPRYYPMS